MNKKYTYKEATGKLKFSLVNDAFFHLLIQYNEVVCKDLLCSLLHMKKSDICDIQVLNPIKVGETIASKEFVLDILVRFNNGAYINLEMQVVNEHNWTDRSLSYIGRLLNQLKKKAPYESLQPVVHIGFLNYTLFPEYPEFLASYRLMNQKNNNLYTDKLAIYVVDLTKIELATEEDKAYHTDLWGKFFKAKTWKELEDLIAQNPIFEEAAQTVHDFQADDNIRSIIEDRDDYYRRINSFKYKIDNLTMKVDEQASTIREQAIMIDGQTRLIEELKKQLEEQGK